MEQTVYSQNDFRNYELYHHGVLGQKWGKHNGPPYPLDSSVSTGHRLKKSYTNANGDLNDNGKAKRSSIIKQTETAKKVGKVVGGIVGGAAGVGASAAITLTSGFIVPHLQVGITAGAVAGGAKAFESALQKIGDKRLADFDKKVSKERETKESEEQQKKYSTKEEAQKAAEKQFKDDYNKVINAKTEAERSESKKQAKSDYDKRMKEIDDEFGGSVSKAKQQFEKDVEKANKAKTDEEHDKLNREADEKYAKAAAETRQYYKDNKDRLLKNAKEKDQYDMEFLERSNPNGEWDNKRYISEYEKYLDDPYSYQPYEYRKNK